MNINVRRFKNGDEYKISEIIRKDLYSENIKDYPKESIDKLADTLSPEFILKRATAFHGYVVLGNDEIIGVGMIGPYWGSETESSFFTIFIDPDYIGKGIGRKIIETLEQDEYYLRADRVEIPASITGLDFYRHFGYDFKITDKVFGNIVDEEGEYRLQKYPKRYYSNKTTNLYNIKPYINNEYHNYYDFICNLKDLYYEETLDEFYIEDKEIINKESGKYFIIQLNGKDIGFYKGELLEDGSYSFYNICLIPEYQNKEIEVQILRDYAKKYNELSINHRCITKDPIELIYKDLNVNVIENDSNVCIKKR